MLRIARNPDPDSTLPFVLSVPLGPQPLVLKAKDTWPRRSPSGRASAGQAGARGGDDAVDGSLLHRLSELAIAPRAAVVVEDRGPMCVPIVFAETRPLAQEYAYRFLGAALRDAEEEAVEL